ncbi:MAG: NAD(P)/FAD-dependent oxidoreductase [Myxococcales bacterium]|nr:NAD(P)/FAD-dependent oxidoreductase [Myxococcales bacterium]
MSQNQYDVVVIGAGLGGLSAAAYLAKRGRRVLLLEKHNVPGGYATSFVRGRFEFEIALHELSGVGTAENPGPLYRYLKYLGITDQVEFVTIPDFYRSVFADYDVTLPLGREAYEQKLCAEFPAEADGIRRFLKRVYALGDELRFFNKLALSGRLPKVDQLAQIPLNLPNLARYALTTWGQVLNRDVKDQRARAVLSQLWGYMGMPPAKASYLYFATMLTEYLDYGPAHVKGRSQTLSQAFVSVLEKAGGEVRFNCAAERILTRNGKVIGVATCDGDEIAAGAVVSNADPVTTCREMIGLEKIPAKFWRRLRSSTIGPSSFNVYLGLAVPPEKLGLANHEVFINVTDDFDAHYAQMRTLDEPQEISVTAYNTVLPEISPPGTSMVVLTLLTYADPWYHVPPREYVDTKNRIAGQMIDLAERLYPGLRAAAEVVEVSTPITNMRYANAMGGSIYGFDQPPEDSSFFRLPHWGPLKNLFFVGAWTPPGGGFEPAMMSGRIAGEVILRQTKRTGKEA